MNSNAIKALYFVTGLAIGSIGTWLGVKKYYELKADLEVESVREAFTEKLSEIEDAKSSLDGEIEGPEEIDEPEPGVKPTVSSLTQRLNNKPPLKDYSKMFKEKGGEKVAVKEIMREENKEEELAAESEGPQDDMPLTDAEDRDQQLDFEDYELNGEHRKAIAENRAPYIIDKADYELTCANYEKITLLYYISDDVLSDDSGDEISRMDVIGSTILNSGFTDNDDDVLYVRNDKLMCDYEVTKVYIPYEK